MLTSKCRAKAAFATATAATIDDGALKTHFEEIARDWISLAAAAVRQGALEAEIIVW